MVIPATTWTTPVSMSSNRQANVRMSCHQHSCNSQHSRTTEGATNAGMPRIKSASSQQSPPVNPETSQASEGQTTAQNVHQSRLPIRIMFPEQWTTNKCQNTPPTNNGTTVLTPSRHAIRYAKWRQQQ
jgi:hypothetical protein